MEVIVMKIVMEEGSAVVAGLIRSSIGPLASDGLDEAFSLAIGLRSVRFGKVMLEAEFTTAAAKSRER